MEQIAKFEMERIAAGRLTGKRAADLSRISESRGGTLQLAELAQLASFVLGIPIAANLACMARGWMVRRRAVIENWCDAQLRAEGHAPRNFPEPIPGPLVRPQFPRELVPFASVGAL